MSRAQDRFATKGQVWVCGACGKTAKDRYGMEGEHSPGWDESCALNAVLCDETKRFDPETGILSWRPIADATSERVRP